MAQAEKMATPTLTPEPRGAPPMPESQGDIFSGIPEENLTKEQKEAKQNLTNAFIAIKQVNYSNLDRFKKKKIKAFGKVNDGMMYIQVQNLNVAKKLVEVQSIDVRYFHLDIPVICEIEDGVVKFKTQF